MKKKIKALFLAIFIGISSFFSNILSASATVPGVVGAENVWQLWETLAFTLGVSLSFDDSKTISYNNDYQRQALEEQILLNYQAGRITQAQYEESMQNIDNIIEDANTHGIGNVIKIGENLWSQLTQFYYSQYIESTINLYPQLSGDCKSYFDAYSGRCAIYSTIYPTGVLPQNTSITVVFGNGCLSQPIFDTYYSSINASIYKCYESTTERCDIFYNTDSTVRMDQALTYSDWFVGRDIYVQYWDYKEANETIIDGENEDALVSFPSYQDYIDKLNEIYEILNGQLVVTDTQEAPTILDGETVGDAVAGIQDGITTWEDAVPTAFEAEEAGTIEGENPVINKRALDEMVTGLRLNRLKTKFPFCIPSDIYHMVSDAGALDDEAPVIKIPIHIEFRGHVYYDDDEAVVIDFNEYQSVIIVFRAGFFLLFLIGMIFLTIEVLHSFFVVTE